MKQERIIKAIFGFKDKVTGERLREFFKKHTGKDIDFNKIQHYKSGFKLLLFSIPLDKVDVIGIAAAGATPFKKFSSLDDFVDWYEKKYLKGLISKTELRRISILRNINNI